MDKYSDWIKIQVLTLGPTTLIKFWITGFLRYKKKTSFIHIFATCIIIASTTLPRKISRAKIVIFSLESLWLKKFRSKSMDQFNNGKFPSLPDCPNRFYSDDVSSALNFFILGGSRAYRSEFPHMVSLHVSVQ